MYAVMDPELKGYCFNGPDSPKWYEDHKKYILMEGSTIYRYVLVGMKRVKSGFSIKIKFYWHDWWLWKPDVSFKYDCHFHWLFFLIFIHFEYNQIPDKIVKDFYRESNGIL